MGRSVGGGCACGRTIRTSQPKTAPRSPSPCRRAGYPLGGGPGDEGVRAATIIRSDYPDSVLLASARFPAWSAGCTAL
jgi:hypothetical protein